jgi:hypothetical protein
MQSACTTHSISFLNDVVISIFTTVAISIHNSSDLILEYCFDQHLDQLQSPTRAVTVSQRKHPCISFNITMCLYFQYLVAMPC